MSSRKAVSDGGTPTKFLLAGVFSSWDGLPSPTPNESVPHPVPVFYYTLNRLNFPCSKNL